MNGKRAPNGFSGRALPHFPRGDRTPEGKGFVAASFYRCAAAIVHAMNSRLCTVPRALEAASGDHRAARDGGRTRKRSGRAV